MRSLALGVLITGLAAPAIFAAPHARRADAYILAVGRGWTTSDVDMDELAAMRDSLSGDFLWFRRAGRTWRVTDPAVLARARACFAERRALEPELEAFREREEAFDAKEDALDRERDAIDGDLESLDADEEAGLGVSDAERAGLEAQREAVEARARVLSPERREMEAAERELDAREEELEQEAEAKLWTLIDETVASGIAKPYDSRTPARR